MDIRNRRALKQTANARLAEAAYDPKMLALIHTGISLGAGLIVALVNYYLSHQIDSAGGLSGMGTRSVLETVQTTLQYVLTFVLPFWEIGFVYAALRMARGQRADFDSLLEGFRQFRPVLRLKLLQIALYLGVGIICMYAGSFLFMLTPASVKMMESFLPIMESGGSIEQMEAAMAAIPLEELMQMMAPFLVIFGILFAAVAIFLFYRFRMAEFIVMDQPKTGPWRALRQSSRMTRRKRMDLLKLDLSFWWFYLLLAVSAAVSYGDLLLPWMGISLPISEDLAWIVFYLLGMVVQLVVFWYAFSYVQTTYATAYDVLLQQKDTEQPQQVQPEEKEPKSLPWNDYNEA